MGPTIDESVCLFLDVDGTLIDIAARPDTVIVPTSLIDVLSDASRALNGAMALVSGRTIANLDALFQPLKLVSSGVHGAEVRYEPNGAVTHEERDLIPTDVTAAILQATRPFPGTLVEDKRFSVAVHYRQAPEAGPQLAAALERIVTDAQDPELCILAGHMVFDIKRATFDKGLAVRRFMARPPFAGRTPVFFGDDITDKPGFSVVLAEGGQAYSVGQVFPGTSGSFPDPASVRSWLAGFAASETSHV